MRPNDTAHQLRAECRASEFYGPLSVAGAQYRAEPETVRARQLHALVRLRCATHRDGRAILPERPPGERSAAVQPGALPEGRLRDPGCRLTRPRYTIQRFPSISELEARADHPERCR